MPFALVTIGLILVITGARNTHKDFGATLAADFTGPGNFTWWLVAIGSVGALGYIRGMEGFSRAFMALIIISMVLKNGGVFDKAREALAKGPIAPVAAASNTPGGSGVTDSSLIGDAANLALKIAPLLL